MRQQRRENLQRHIEEVNAAIRPVDRNRDESGDATEEDGDEDEDVFEGFEEPEPVDREGAPGRAHGRRYWPCW